jgi:MFS family permease
VGWDNPYEYVLLVVAMGHFAMFITWEARFATNPVIPVDIWKTPSFAAITLVLFLVFMSLGIYIWYVILFLANIRLWRPVFVGLAWLPVAISGIISAFLAAWAVPKMSAQIIISAGCVGAAGMNILLVTTPVHQSFWAMIFPAMILAAFSGDMVFAAGQIIASSIVSKKSQGAAGSLIGTLFTYGLSTGLGFAGTVETYVNSNGADLLAGYRGAAYLGIGFAGAALVVNILFVRVKKNTVEGWQEEDVV